MLPIRFTPAPSQKAHGRPRPWSRAPWWDRPALFRYGFVAVILIVWQIVGPFINPIFFTYPTKIAAAFYTTTVSGELPYFLGQSLEVMVYGLSIAILVGIPLGNRDGAHTLARLGARPADQRALRNAAGGGSAAAGALVWNLSEGQDHRRVLVRRVSGPDQHLSGRARVRQEYARSGAFVPLERVAGVARRAAARLRCPTSSPACALPSAAGSSA